MNAKKQVIELMKELPEECTLDDIMAALYFRQKVERGLQDMEAGRILTQDEVEKRMKQWALSIGQ